VCVLYGAPERVKDTGGKTAGAPLAVGRG
jgi:hypothetical protein